MAAQADILPELAPPEYDRVHPLTVIDRSVDRKYVQRMLVFDFPDPSRVTVDAATSSIRAGLEVAFKHYPFLTGKLGLIEKDMVSHLELRYQSTAASEPVSDHIFKVVTHEIDEGFDAPYKELCERGLPVSHWPENKFCASYQGDWRSHDWLSVFALQANFLKHGALVLCFAFQNSIADSSSIAEFLEVFCLGTCGEIRARECKDENQEINLGFFVPDANYVPEIHDFPEWNFNEDARIRRQPGQYITGIYTFPADRIRGIQQAVETILMESGHVCKISASKCLFVMMWIHLTRAGARRLMENRERSSLLTFTVDCRKALNEHVPDHYLGNLSLAASVRASFEELTLEVNKKGQLRDVMALHVAALALLVRDRFDDVNQEYIAKRLSMLQDLGDPHKASVAERRATANYWSGFKMESLADEGADLDFGIPGTPEDGRPRAIRVPWVDIPGTVKILPRRGGYHNTGDAPWEVLICMEWDECFYLHRSTELGAYFDGAVKDGRPGERQPIKMFNFDNIPETSAFDWE